MSDEIISITHETIGRNTLLIPILQKLSFAEIIDQKVDCDAEIPYGTVASAIVLSRFSPQRVPMYKLDDFCEENGLATLYQVDSSKFNDDRAGRCLDAMHPSLTDIKARLILLAIKEFDIKVNQIHTDITNILFEGSYENLSDGQLQVTYGHTKKGQDSRCKQVNFSLSVTSDGGVPLWYDALDGNTNDSVSYLPHLSALSNTLGIASPLIVGDSKLVSNNNMIAFCRADAFFIGPATLDENGKKKLYKLWKQGACFSALELKKEDNKPIPYWGMETERKLYDKKENKIYQIRQIYIFSRQRREVIRHTRAKKFLSAKNELHKIIRCLNKYDYTSASVINYRIKQRVLSKCPYYKIKLTKDSQGFFSIEYSIDWEKLHYDEMFDGIYIIRTNLEKKEFPQLSVLGSYKEQSTIENSFSTIKQPPIQVSPLWLHKPQRIESLLFCVFVAFLVMALLQREGRAKVWEKKIPIRPEGRDYLPLTANVLLSAFDNIAIYTITQKNENKLVTFVRCSPLTIPQRDILLALSFPSPSQYLKGLDMVFN